MADNVNVNSAGTTPIATDDVAGVQFQKIKLDVGGDGVSIPATGDATNGLDVDVTRLPVSSVATLASIPSSLTSVTLAAFNASRKGAMVHNDSTQLMYLKLGSPAQSTSFTVKMPPDAYYEVPFGYLGIISGIWLVVNGNARVTELT